MPVSTTQPRLPRRKLPHLCLLGKRLLSGEGREAYRLLIGRGPLEQEHPGEMGFSLAAAGATRAVPPPAGRLFLGGFSHLGENQKRGTNSHGVLTLLGTHRVVRHNGRAWPLNELRLSLPGGKRPASKDCPGSFVSMRISPPDGVQGSWGVPATTRRHEPGTTSCVRARGRAVGPPSQWPFPASPLPDISISSDFRSPCQRGGHQRRFCVASVVMRGCRVPLGV